MIDHDRDALWADLQRRLRRERDRVLPELVVASSLGRRVVEIVRRGRA